ncbi:TcaA NTF2-like domain-containing protein [Halalkalibacter akibai]|uniref:TcaA protein NTF2-like domain-containing protein n=1 Tax=Halalkalibacter akibai (strain ATCC 43226 / DSM 21942 / CIP 109018 / JCM 9157 / 1139) TaxID=1236973 RepID=W4QP17_HALA3|nr:hypothetical protein [Halalkalibacter akibai]GAE33821.1 hypothetical protein JCM9157_847 [Halalkalibacter akibai JCM 9157]
MKRIFVVILFFMLAGCGADPDQFTVVEGTEAEEVEEFVKKYKQKMVEAFNTGDFNELEAYLITNNSFYHSLRRYISDSHSEGTTKVLNDFIVETVYKDEIDEYHVDVKESVTLIEYGQEKIVERDVRFEVIRGGTGTLRIVTIRQRK